MAGLPGSIPSMIPAGPDELVRRMRDLERRMDEMGPSVARSFLPMLATVVQGGQEGTWETNFAVPTGTGTAVASVSIGVPDGFTSAIVFAIAHASAHNTTAGAEFFYVGASINSVVPAMLLAPMPPSGYATSSGSASRILTGLSGGVIDVEAMVHSETASWTATGSNLASIDAIAIFYH
jgi:hypothetical protein